MFKKIFFASVVTSFLFSGYSVANDNEMRNAYRTPIEGMQAFAEKSEKVGYSKDRPKVERKENETGGMFLFRSFKNYVQNSSDEFKDRSGMKLGNKEDK